MNRTLTIWDEEGRELVCYPLDADHHARQTRIGLTCKVMKTDGDKGFSHVYYDNDPFCKGAHLGPASIFYQNGSWWRSFVHLKGWEFSFNPPRKQVLQQELSVLAARIIAINREIEEL